MAAVDDIPVEMWRLRIARGNRNSGGGDWTMYDNRSDLEHALFAHAVEAEAHANTKGRVTNERRWRWFKAWWRVNTPNADESTNAYHTYRIVGVDRLLDDEWVGVEWSISPPVLTLGGADG